MTAAPPLVDRLHDEPLLTDYLIRRVIGRATGDADLECTHLAPRDKYFIGSLRPSPQAALGGPIPFLDELLSKLAPVSFGAEFKVRSAPTPVAVNVVLRWNCYYRVFPEFSEQQAYQRLAESDSEVPTESPAEDGDAGTQSLPSPSNQAGATAAAGGIAIPPSGRSAPASADVLFPKYRRVTCAAAGVIRLQPGTGDTTIPRVDVSELQEACNQELARARQVVASDPDHLRTGVDAQERVRVPVSALQSAAAFAALRNALPRHVVPAWQWSITGMARAVGGSNDHVLELDAANTSSIDTRDWSTEGFFFDVRLSFDFARDDVSPFEVEHAPQSFRYNRTVWARGFNCIVSGPTEEGTRRLFESASAPVYRQSRYATNTHPPAAFRALADDPTLVLRAVQAAMLAYNAEWDRQRAAYVSADANWETEHGVEYDRDRARFQDERARFERGCSLIETDADARLAFQLTNEAFASAGGKTAWRLFQVVFIVSQIPSVVALAGGEDDAKRDREVVDIVYFPTGGGKTEAYLGAVVFHCFYDRLRGKTAGVTAWTRFPLRLLTLQQMQRVADVIGLAELVRKGHGDARLSGRHVDPLAVGYFVGEEATPNELVPPVNGGPPDPKWSTALDAVARQRWKMVVRCPACRTNSVTVDFDVDAVRVLHRCTNADCRFSGGILPVHVVDNEIYRYLPSVVVGTIDKLAGIGNQRKMSMVLGMVTGRCQKHGYYSAKCCQKDCTDATRLRPGAPRGVSGPTLFVQDELHLLKEGFGTFDGHYETCLHELLVAAGQTTAVKIIASSATIEAFDRQVRHLYGRDARVFPGVGPTLADSFYAQTLATPQRLFVGVLPHNKTILNATLELIQFYHEEVELLSRVQQSSGSPFGGRVTPGTSDWLTLLDPYVTSLVYFSATRELNSTRTDLDAHVNSQLHRAGYSGLRIAELSGSTSTDAVTGVLERLENAVPGSDTAPNVVLATSMISHGVDVDRFNCMAFFGMPRANAEYIQSSSRVGRSHVGIVFTCFKPARERDRSHFTYFDKYHEYLGRLVEPVAINRWSKFAMERTIPGLFMAVLLQYVANRSGQANPNVFYMVDFVKRQISDGTLRVDDFVAMLENGYKVDQAPGDAAIAFREEIRRRVRMFFDQILGAGGNATFVSEALIPTPMRSLRDVDEQVPVELDGNGSNWATVSAR